ASRRGSLRATSENIECLSVLVFRLSNYKAPRTLARQMRDLQPIRPFSVGARHILLSPKHSRDPNGMRREHAAGTVPAARLQAFHGIAVGPDEDTEMSLDYLQ